MMCCSIFKSSYSTRPDGNCLNEQADYWYWAWSSHSHHIWGWTVQRQVTRANWCPHMTMNQSRVQQQSYFQDRSRWWVKKLNDNSFLHLCLKKILLSPLIGTKRYRNLFILKANVIFPTWKPFSLLCRIVTRQGTTFKGCLKVLWNGTQTMYFQLMYFLLTIPVTIFKGNWKCFCHSEWNYVKVSSLNVLSIENKFFVEEEMWFYLNINDPILGAKVLKC